MSALEDQTQIPDMDLILPKLVAVVSHKHSTITLISALSEYQDQFLTLENTLKSLYHYTPLAPYYKRSWWRFYPYEITLF